MSPTATLCEGGEDICDPEDDLAGCVALTCLEALRTRKAPRERRNGPLDDQSHRFRWKIEVKLCTGRCRNRFHYFAMYAPHFARAQLLPSRWYSSLSMFSSTAILFRPDPSQQSPMQTERGRRLRILIFLISKAEAQCCFCQIESLSNSEKWHFQSCGILLVVRSYLGSRFSSHHSS